MWRDRANPAFYWFPLISELKKFQTIVCEGKNDFFSYTRQKFTMENFDLVLTLEIRTWPQDYRLRFGRIRWCYKMDSQSKPSFCQKNSVHTKFNLQIIPNCKVFNFCQPIVCTESPHIMRSWKIYLKNNLLLGFTLNKNINSLWKP